MADVILVPFDGSVEALRVLASACEVAAATGSVVEVVHVEQLPRSLPLCDPPESIRAAAEAIVARARDVGVSKGVSVETRLAFTYDEAAELVREARRVRPRAIFISVQPSHFNRWPIVIPRAARLLVRMGQCPVYLGYFPSVLGLTANDALAQAEQVLREHR